MIQFKGIFWGFVSLFVKLSNKSERSSELAGFEHVR